jgi:hypothetical protein
MERHAEAKPFDGVADRVLQVGDAGAGFLGGFEDARANLLLVADIFVDRKHREQPVAHIFQHFAAMIPDRGNLAVEVIIQHIDHGFRRHAIGQRGEAAQIGQPDRGIHGLGMAAPDLAAEDALAGAVADIRIQQARRGARQANDLDHARQRRHDPSQRRQLFFRKSARLLGGPARCVHRAADEGQRQRDIIRDTFDAKFVDDRKALAPDIIGAGSNLQPLLENDLQRAGVKIR